MREFLKRSGILVIALLAGNFGGLLVVPFGLVVVEFVIFPLTFAVGALFAAIGAGWLGNLVAPGGSRFLPIVAVSEIMAAVVAVVLLVLMATTPLGTLPAPLFIVALGMILIALGASWAAWHFRSPERHMGIDAAITLGLVGLAALLFVATLFVAGLLGLTGP
jgi:hypothetical protein